VTGGLVALWFLWAVAILVAFVYPGWGFAAALATGRHVLPSRSAGVIPAAPVFLAATLLGMAFRRIRAKRDDGTECLALILALSVGVGSLLAVRLPIGLRPYADEKALLLLGVVVPLVLLTPFLSPRTIRSQFLRGMVVIPAGLGLLSWFNAASAVDDGRAAALGGGPIVLAQLCGFGVIILFYSHGDVLSVLPKGGRKAFAIAIASVLVITLFETGSRFPAIALTAVFIGETLIEEWNGRRRNRTARRGRRRALVLAGLAAGTSMWFSIVANPGSRFALLRDPSMEFERSRLDVWMHGLDRTYSGGPVGHGLGSFPEGAYGTAKAQSYPHNLVLELLSETGWVAGGLLLVSIIVIAVRAAKRAQPVARALTVYSLLVAQVSGDLYNARYVFVFLAFASVSSQSTRLRAEDKILDEFSSLASSG
jgi:hypothetical protein